MRSLWAPTIQGTLRIDGGRDVHPPAFLHLLGREIWRSLAPADLSLVPLQTCLYPFAGGLHLEGSPDQQSSRGGVWSQHRSRPCCSLLMATTPMFCLLSAAWMVGLHRVRPAFVEGFEYATV